MGLHDMIFAAGGLFLLAMIGMAIRDVAEGINSARRTLQEIQHILGRIDSTLEKIKTNSQYQGFGQGWPPRS